MNYVENFKEFVKSYSDHLDIDLINKALDFAHKYHYDQKRKSNLPYISHPIAIAKNLIQYNFDTTVVAAALLHDTMEDTDALAEDITSNFGEDIYSLVLGLTKLEKTSFASFEESQIENYRKFILAINEDIRVLIIKIFDRLDNIRTIQYFTNVQKQKRIAIETLNIYAPLADRISLHSIKDELEDACFAIIEPNIRALVLKNIKYLEGLLIGSFNKFSEDISNILDKNGITQCAISSRIKSPYSIWKKIINSRCSFYDIRDIFALRIVAKNKEDCYKILGLIHTHYKADYKKFKDYISSPKSNGYQSLHSILMLKNDLFIEIQIRDQSMDQYAEFGIAAHWNYKNPTDNSSIKVYKWLENFVTLLHQPDVKLEDIYEYSKLELFKNEIFTFTPKGKLVVLPEGSTALDFAYHIHSDIGNTCYQVLVDDVIQPLFYVLSNGQKVEIVTKDTQSPEQHWLNYVQTSLAKICIKKNINSRYNKENEQKAISILKYIFDKEGIYFDFNVVSQMIHLLNLKNNQVFYQMIIDNAIDIYELIEELFPMVKTSIQKNHKYIDAVDLSSIEHLNISNVKFAQCCHCINGSPIVGVLLPNNYLDIHHESCENLSKTDIDTFRLIYLYWKQSKSKKVLNYIAKLKISLNNLTDSFLFLSKYCHDNNIQLVSIADNKKGFTLESKKSNITMLIIVRDIIEVKHIIKDLKLQENIKKVTLEVN